MEARKSQDLLSVSQRTSKADGVMQLKAKGLRIGVDGLSPRLSPKAREAGTLVSEGRKRWTSRLRRGNSPFLHFILVGPSLDWLMPSYIGESGSSSLSQLNQMLVSSRDTLTDTPRYNVSWPSPSPVKLTHIINPQSKAFVILTDAGQAIRKRRWM